jgi:hypothetical protein
MDIKTAAIEHLHSTDSEKNASSDDSLLQFVRPAEQAPQALFTRRMFKLYAILSLGYMCIVLQGYDGSLMGAINDMVSLYLE